MSKRSTLALVLLLLSGLTPVPPVIAAEPPVPRQAPAEPSPFTVYFPEDQRGEQQPKTVLSTLARQPARPPESPWLVVSLLAILLAAVLLWMRLRAPQCPRCRTKMAVLEPAEGAQHPALEALNCPACGELARRKNRLFLVRDLRCPACKAPTKVSRLATLERPGYLTWGEMRLDEECASCTYRASTLYAAPPFEAPARARPRSA